MEATLLAEQSHATPVFRANGLKHVSRTGRSSALARCHAGDLAILSTRFGTRVVQVKGRAADICYDWKVEVLGSPVWCVDARSDMPALTNLGLVKDKQLFPLETDDMELSLA